jgi:nucleoside-diphosphate-sugar epimerase
VTSLVTGASGFIGGVLVRQLQARGDDVRTWSRGQPLTLDGVDVVFHLAAPVDPSRDADWKTMLEGIVVLTEQLAQSCLQADVQLVHVGTCEEYGDGPAPFHEDQLPQPVSPYSTAKVAATMRVLALHRNHGLRATVARPFLTYGPGQGEARLIPAAIAAALAREPFPMTEGTQTREVNYVDDIAAGLMACAAPEAVGRILNIGGGPELTVYALVQRIFEAVGADPALVQRGALPSRSGETARFVGNHRRARLLLGHAPGVTLDEGLRRTIESR